ncbi:hypothetical protein PAECIP111893_01523 [Paenibacillus plantiphilus]|uniref:Uncharacterized protein n=1 Tax=Paenibacillus plantiphilus TaxID=2905650 RepID=A0ABN8G651_9BACL|nr:hypothetical protein PAECIP111893_01523 [Paenibacillus plantiphilus]
MVQVSLLRLYILRALYLFVVLGLAVMVWPGVIFREEPMELMESAVNSMLAAYWLLCILGLRYPLQMLPILLWELVWKSLWLIVVAVPQWATGVMDESTWEVAFSCLMVVIFPFIIPWRYVFLIYVKRRGERWR